MIFFTQKLGRGRLWELATSKAWHTVTLKKRWERPTEIMGRKFWWAEMLFGVRWTLYPDVHRVDILLGLIELSYSYNRKGNGDG